jgi:glycosyltransferase involved in cell wall biosynthesis
MASEPKLAVIATHLRPAKGFGGVAESTAELIRGWRRAGRNIAVAVSDGTRGPPVTQAAFEDHLGAPVFVYRARGAIRWGFGLAAPFAITRAIFGATAVYVSGIATWPATIGAYAALLARKPYVVAPRGGLMPEHWREVRQGKPLKWLYYKFLVFPSLRRARAVHVSTELEAQGVRELLPGVPLVIAPNAFEVPANKTQPVSASAGLQLIFVGRLAHEKGILGFAKKFAEIRSPDDHLAILGPPEGAYGKEVVELCAVSPGLSYLGIASREELVQHLGRAQALVLSSGVDGDVRENFGNVVVEALLHGRPCLVTRGLAWDMLPAAKVGANFDRSLSDLPSAIAEMRKLTSAPEISSSSRAFAKDNFSVEVVSGNLWKAIFEEEMAR